MQDPADVLITGGPVWTGVPEAPLAEAVAIRGGRVMATGTGSELSGHRGESTRVIDLSGRLVTPGFIDSHVHFLSGGFKLSSVQLRDASSPDEFARRIGAFAETVEPGTWISGGDWDHEAWGGELPHRAWIDSLTPDHPVWVSRLDGHMALANSLALEAAGITAWTPDIEGGEIVRDAETNVPTGLLKDEAMAPVWDAMPEPSAADRDRALAAAVAHALARGVTQVHDMAGWADLETYRRARASDRLGLRIYSLVPLVDWERMRDYVTVHGRGDDRLWWGGLKAFVDGSLGSTTAWFYEAYADAPETAGLTVTDPDALERWIRDADAAGLHVVVHAIGDRANDWLLDAYARAERENGDRDRRFRVEHAQHLTPGALARFGEQGVIASMQPYHAVDDGRWAEKRIGPERIRTTYAFRALLDAGATLAFGSDWTVAPIDPLLGIDAAVNRRTLDGQNPEGWVPEQRISLREALKAYTVGAAFAGFAESFSGTLEPGKQADLVILGQDLLSMDPGSLESVTVDLTMVAGHVVYERR